LVPLVTGTPSIEILAVWELPSLNAISDLWKATFPSGFNAGPSEVTLQVPALHITNSYVVVSLRRFE
jgi:hypothetical protein